MKGGRGSKVERQKTLKGETDLGLSDSGWGLTSFSCKMMFAKWGEIR